MKQKPADLETFISRPQPDIGLVLLFGNDEGRVRDLGRRLTTATVPSKSDPFLYVELDDDIVRQDPQRLQDEFFTLGLFGDRRIVRLRLAQDKSSAALKAFLATIESTAAPFPALCIVEADSLNANSVLRKAAENSKKMIAVLCDRESGGALREHIKARLKAAGLDIRPKALGRMTEVLGENAAQTDREIEKLILYKLGDRTAVTGDDVAASLSGDGSMAPSRIAEAVLGGDLPALERLLSKAALQNESLVGLCRSLTWLLEAPDRGGRGASALTPRQKDQAQQLLFWTENALKQTGTPEWPVFRNALYRIARSAKAAGGAPTPL